MSSEHMTPWGELVCCARWNEGTDDDGNLIYPDICECICHAEEKWEHDD